MPKNLEIDTFPDPLYHFGAPWRPFWILQAVRRCRRLVSAPFAARQVFSNFSNFKLENCSFQERSEFYRKLIVTNPSSLAQSYHQCEFDPNIYASELIQLKLQFAKKSMKVPVN